MPIGMADHPQSPLVWSLLVMMLDRSSQKVCFFPFSGLSDSSLPRDWTWAMAVKALSPNQWTARKFPQKHLLGMQSGIITLQNSSVISYKVKNTYFTTQEPLLGIYPKEMKRFIHEKTCLQMFIVALFITTTNWKQSHCLSTGEGMKRNVVNPYTEFCSARNRNRLLYRPRRGCISSVWWCLKEARLKRLPMAGLHPYDILKKANQ